MVTELMVTMFMVTIPLRSHRTLCPSAAQSQVSTSASLRRRLWSITVLTWSQSLMVSTHLMFMVTSLVAATTDRGSWEPRPRDGALDLEEHQHLTAETAPVTPPRLQKS